MVKQHIIKMITFMTKPLDPEAAEFKMTALRIFLASGKKRSYKCMILLTLLPGDWRLRDRIEISLEQDECADQKKELVAEGVSQIVAGSQIHQWPRHRWKGADIAASDVGLLETVHGLLSSVCPIFVDSCRQHRRTDRTCMETVEAMPGAAGSGSAEAGDDDDVAAASAAELALVPYAEPAHVGDAFAAAAGAAGVAGGASGGPGAEDNSRFRSKAKTFVEQKPHDALVQIRLVIEPLRVLMDLKLWIGSQRWELKQQARAAIGSETSSTPWPHRSFPLLEAAMNTSEQVFFNKLGALSNAAMWKCICNITESRVASAFKTISRAGCMVEELLAAPHRRSPFDLYKVIVQPEAGPTLAELPKCMQHEVVQDFVHEYGSKLGNMESRMKLFLLMLSSRTDISQLESLHALIRRMIHMRVQTHGLSMKDLSALWCCRKQRRSLPQDMPGSKRKALTCDDAAPEDSAKKRKTGHQNSWHMFCRQV